MLTLYQEAITKVKYFIFFFKYMVSCIVYVFNNIYYFYF